MNWRIYPAPIGKMTGQYGNHGRKMLPPGPREQLINEPSAQYNFPR